MKYLGTTCDDKSAYLNSDGNLEVYSGAHGKCDDVTTFKRIVTRFKSINEYNNYIWEKQKERRKFLEERKKKEYDPYKDPKQMKIE